MKLTHYKQYVGVRQLQFFLPLKIFDINIKVYIKIYKF